MTKTKTSSPSPVPLVVTAFAFIMLTVGFYVLARTPAEMTPEWVAVTGRTAFPVMVLLTSLVLYTAMARVISYLAARTTSPFVRALERLRSYIAREEPSYSRPPRL